MATGESLYVVPTIALVAPWDILIQRWSTVWCGRSSGQPSEIAHSYVFLAGEGASYMTGQVLHPNGGTIVGG